MRVCEYYYMLVTARNYSIYYQSAVKLRACSIIIK